MSSDVLINLVLNCPRALWTHGSTLAAASFQYLAAINGAIKATELASHSPSRIVFVVQCLTLFHVAATNNPLIALPTAFAMVVFTWGAVRCLSFTTAPMYICYGLLTLSLLLHYSQELSFAAASTATAGLLGMNAAYPGHSATNQVGCGLVFASYVALFLNSLGGSPLLPLFGHLLRCIALWLPSVALLTVCQSQATINDSSSSPATTIIAHPPPTRRIHAEYGAVLVCHLVFDAGDLDNASALLESFAQDVTDAAAAHDGSFYSPSADLAVITWNLTGPQLAEPERRACLCARQLREMIGDGLLAQCAIGIHASRFLTGTPGAIPICGRQWHFARSLVDHCSSLNARVLLSEPVYRAVRGHLPVTPKGTVPTEGQLLMAAVYALEDPIPNPLTTTSVYTVGLETVPVGEALVQTVPCNVRTLPRGLPVLSPRPTLPSVIPTLQPFVIRTSAIEATDPTTSILRGKAALQTIIPCTLPVVADTLGFIYDVESEDMGAAMDASSGTTEQNPQTLASGSGIPDIRTPSVGSATPPNKDTPPVADLDISSDLVGEGEMEQHALELPERGHQASWDQNLNEDQWWAAVTPAAMKGKSLREGGELPAITPEGKDSLWYCSSQLLGQGGFGEVYLGVGETGMLVAIKRMVLETDHRKRLMNEVRLLCRCQHNNIIRYLGCAADETHVMVVMEYACTTLARILQCLTKFTLALAGEYTRDIVAGLSYLHAQNVIHRDIKPENVLLTQMGVCRLADFGTAMAVEVPAAEGVTTLSGTPYYMAPEAVRGEIGPKVDVWALGITVHYMLVGSKPIGGDVSNVNAVFYQLAILSRSPEVPTDIPDVAQQFLEGCLCLNPTERPSASDLLRHPFVHPVLVQ